MLHSLESSAFLPPSDGNFICKVILVLWLGLTSWTSRVFVTSLVKKRDFPQKKREAVSHPNQWVSLQVRILHLQLKFCVQLCFPAKILVAKGPRQRLFGSWERQKKSSCCVFLFVWCFLLCLEACGAPGEGKKRNFIFSWEKSRLYRLPSKCKNSDTSLLRKSATKTEPAEYSTSSIEGTFLK